MSLRLTEGINGLARLVLEHPSGSTAAVYLHGAHLTSWIPSGGDEALFVSEAARYGAGEAIRGGVPIIFPQFADFGPLPKHGFARTAAWEWAGATDGPEAAPSATLRLRASAATRALWPYAFEADYTVELGAHYLRLKLAIHNADTRPFPFTAALHSYLRLADVRKTVIKGLHRTTYLDRTADEQERLDEAPLLVIDGEVDRVYLDVADVVQVRDDAAGRVFNVRGEGFPDVVVWNPWTDLAARLPDMEDEDYLHMVSVEAAQAASPATVAPGGTWEGVQRIDVAVGKG